MFIRTGAAGPRRQQRAQDRRNLLFEGAARFDVLCAFDVGQRMLAQHLSMRSAATRAKSAAAATWHQVALEFAYMQQARIAPRSQAQCEGGQHLHSVARVVPGVRPPHGKKDRHRTVRHGVRVEGNRQPQQQRPAEMRGAASMSQAQRGAEHAEAQACGCPTIRRRRPSRRLDEKEQRDPGIVPAGMRRAEPGVAVRISMALAE